MLYFAADYDYFVYFARAIIGATYFARWRHHARLPTVSRIFGFRQALQIAARRCAS